MLPMTNRQAAMPTIQLQVAPIEPSAPPPMMRKVWSIGATVWPLVTSQVAPRQTSRPPSVTMKEGTLEEGDDEALEGADQARRRGCRPAG